MPYTWMGNEHAAAASVVTLAIPQILAWYEKRKDKELKDEYLHRFQWKV